MPRFNRLLITGAAGNLGRVMRTGLAPLATTLRITDRGDMSPVADNEEAMTCELGDLDAVMQVVEGCGLCDREAREAERSTPSANTFQGEGALLQVARVCGDLFSSLCHSSVKAAFEREVAAALCPVLVSAVVPLARLS